MKERYKPMLNQDGEALTDLYYEILSMLYYLIY